MAHNKNILFIISGSSDSGVGEQFLTSMIGSYPIEHISRYSITSTTPTGKKPYFTKTRTIKSSVRPILSSVNLNNFIKKDLQHCLNDVREIVENKKIDGVWIFLNSLHNILLGDKIVQSLEIPCFVQIWDSPEYILKKSFVSNALKRKVMKSFSGLLGKAVKGFVVSKFMSTNYLEKYNLKSEQMVFSPPADANHAFEPKELDKTIRIVFAGSLYAYKEWNSFLDAIEYHNQTNIDRIISVECIGNMSRWAKKRKWVNYKPLMPQAKASKTINEADIAYLPYWMSKKYSLFVKTAFPGKMSFYTSSGTPVLFHGPKESSPYEFLQDYKVGLPCTTTNLDDILQCVHDLLEENFLNKYSDERQKAMSTIFDKNRSNKLFTKTLELI